MFKFPISLPALQSWFGRSQDTAAAPQPPRNVPTDASDADRGPGRTLEADRPIPRRSTATGSDLTGRSPLSLRERYVRWVAGREARAALQREVAAARRDQLTREFRQSATALVQAVASGKPSAFELAAVRQPGHALHGYFGSAYRRQLTDHLHRKLAELSPELRSRVVRNATAQIAGVRWGAPDELRFIVAAGRLAQENEGRHASRIPRAEGDGKQPEARPRTISPVARVGARAVSPGVGARVLRMIGRPRPEASLSPKFQAFNAWQRGEEETAVRIHLSSLSSTPASSPDRSSTVYPQEAPDVARPPLGQAGRKILVQRLGGLAWTRSELAGLRDDARRFSRAVDELQKFCNRYEIDPARMNEDDLVGYVAPTARSDRASPTGPDA